jgi:hypothetical protein
MPHGVHSTAQTAFRIPEGLLARLKNATARHGLTMTDIVIAGTAAELDRLDGITTSADRAEPVSPPPAAITFTAPLDSPNARIALSGRDDPDCPHPKARINKGLCGACGTYVGR